MNTEVALGLLAALAVIGAAALGRPSLRLRWLQEEKLFWEIAELKSGVAQDEAQPPPPNFRRKRVWLLSVSIGIASVAVFVAVSVIATSISDANAKSELFARYGRCVDKVTESRGFLARSVEQQYPFVAGVAGDAAQRMRLFFEEISKFNAENPLSGEIEKTCGAPPDGYQAPKGE